MGKLKDLYKEIWDSRAHRCVNCGIYISRPVVHNFSHKRSKGARPDLKFDPDNIEILCSSVNRYDRETGCHEYLHTSPSKYRARTVK